ncbi:MAG: cation diffusion facilitator family transporter [Fibrobacteria bacterium]|nr:cation diffusion facilitator family transporter [Fibrobacteria bacterium]
MAPFFNEIKFCPASKSGNSAKACRRCLRIVGHTDLIISLVMLAVKLTVGYITGSKALVVSSMYSLQNCISAIIIVTDEKSRKQADKNHPYGHGKIQIAALGVTSLLVVISVAALCGAVLHSLMYHMQSPPGHSAAVIAFICAAVSLGMAKYAGCASGKNASLAMHTHSFHVIFDAIASLVVIGSVVGSHLGFKLLDAYLAIAMAIHVVWYACLMLQNTARGLMDASISTRKIKIIYTLVMNIPEVEQVSSLKAVRSGANILVSMSIALPGQVSILKADSIRKKVTNAIKEKIAHVDNVLIGFDSTKEPA